MRLRHVAFGCASQGCHAAMLPGCQALHNCPKPCPACYPVLHAQPPLPLLPPFHLHRAPQATHAADRVWAVYAYFASRALDAWAPVGAGMAAAGAPGGAAGGPGGGPAVLQVGVGGAGMWGKHVPIGCRTGKVQAAGRAAGGAGRRLGV